VLDFSTKPKIDTKGCIKEQVVIVRDAMTKKVIRAYKLSCVRDGALSVNSLNDIPKITNRTYTVYSGSKKGKIVYIGTTIQKPKERFRWHKYNGKDLNFEILYQFTTEEEMLDKEFELIQQLKPWMNKIRHRKQNLNAKLTEQTIERRIGDKE